MHARFEDALAEHGRPFLTLSGGHRVRLRTASGAVAPLLRFEPLADP
jgi:hypothetical protein